MPEWRVLVCNGALEAECIIGVETSVFPQAMIWEDASTDLAPLVDVSLEMMDRDSRKMRGDRSFVFSNLKSGEGLDEIIRIVEQRGMLNARKAA